MKIICCVVFWALSIFGQSIEEKPTLEQLINSQKAYILFEYSRDKENISLEAWEKIVVAINKLIDMCYASPYTFPDAKMQELFQEVYNTINYIENERRSGASDGIYGLLEVRVGTWD